MTLTSDPQPRTLPLKPPPLWRPSTTQVSHLEWEPGPETSFHEVLERRESERYLGKLSRSKLGSLFWHAARVRSNTGREHRPAPSAGGLHPIELVVLEPPFTRAQRYDPHRHTIEELATLDETALATAGLSIAQIVSSPSSTVILELASFELDDAFYSDSESLVWRDAGCILATLHLTASWLGLGSCLLGTLGTDAAKIVSPDAVMSGVGAMAVGERTRAPE